MVPPAEPAGVAPQRLDAALAERGLARSRTHAARLIADGRVRVSGRPVVKVAHRVTADDELTVDGEDHYVSRGAQKLLAALDAFAIPVAGREALDVGASTGGFTQVLLERGAERVIALDVGHGQLAPTIAGDPRVDVVEGFNVRELTPGALRDAVGRLACPTLVVADVSFISLTMVIGPVVETVAAGADLVLLVKPQFEVGRGGIREGVVRDAALRADAVAGVLWAAWDAGLGTVGVVSSPVVGTHGNHEYLVHLRAGAANPTQWLERISTLTA